MLGFFCVLAVAIVIAVFVWNARAQASDKGDRAQRHAKFIHREAAKIRRERELERMADNEDLNDFTLPEE